MKHFLSPKLVPMPFKRTFRVHWVDTDVAGVMHFTNYLRYFEACEEEFYNSISLPFNDVRVKYGIIFPRLRSTASIRRPAASMISLMSLRE